MPAIPILAIVSTAPPPSIFHKWHSTSRIVHTAHLNIWIELGKRGILSLWHYQEEWR